MNNIRKKIDLWVATSVYVVSLMFVVTGASYGPYHAIWVPNNTSDYKIELFTTSFPMFEYFVAPYLLRNTILYLTYLFFVLKLIPELKKAKRLTLWLGLTLLGYVLVAAAVAFSDKYLQVYRLYAIGDDEENIQYRMVFNAFLYVIRIFALYGVFVLFKLNEERLLNWLKQKRNASLIIQDCLGAFSIWILIFSLLYMPGITNDYVPVWVCYVLFSIPVYAYYSLWIIPALPKEQLIFVFFNWGFLKISIIGALVVGIGLLLFNFTHRIDLMLYYMGLSVVFHSFTTTPASWLIYRYRLSKWKEVETLETALVNSTANIDFLRSQINPHFLFNTLNTLYGTAIQEHSERTALGIQKLGDMMRFMLHENYQDKILIEKEIGYIRNYIELQRLRIGSSLNVSLETEISEDITGLYIAPMLLIPFIENSFKHGLSRRFQSWIRIKLTVEANKLDFTVANSVHVKKEALEEGRSGVGLENVRQRLELMYFNKHELIIDTTPKEFRVQLTVELK